MRPKTVKEALIALLCVRSIITIICVLGMNLLMFAGVFPIEAYAANIGMILTFFFLRRQTDDEKAVDKQGGAACEIEGGEME
ncbi:MAG: hypothetical protein FWH20_04630 [Oscillospiraceae bacterium]|nr:hypothetical protein [Oscillospiraceae bacterium]